MDEVEHRRRRTRGSKPVERKTDSGDGGRPRMAYRQGRNPSVTPADLADRAPEHGHRTGAGSHLPFDAHMPHHGHDDRDGERGLRGLVGGGSTQVSVSAAMRARDAARPSDEEIAAAEASLTIIHRGWVPRD
jgi:hypothetical protein